MTENRTEVLDASRRAIREQQVMLPRRSRLVETFARHLSNDAKQLVEDEDPGAQRYRYLRTGANHFSMAFTYAWLAFEATRGRSWDPRDCLVAGRRESYDIGGI